MKTFTSIFLLICFLGCDAFAQQAPQPISRKDSIQFGKGSSTADKLLEFNTGDAPNNVQIKVNDSREAAITSQKLQLGDGTAADTVIESNQGGVNPFIKFDQASAKWQFNDGVVTKDFGTGGGGGGINILSSANFDCEAGDPPTNMTVSGGALASETSNPGFGAASCSWDASASSQTYRTDAITIPQGLRGRSCSARIQYKWVGSPGDLNWKIEDSSDVFIAGASDGVTGKDLSVTTDWEEDILFFSCPTSGDMRIELESTSDAALILLDSFELGKVNFVNVSQTTLVTHAAYQNTPSCSWNKSGSTFGAFNADSDCPAITVEQSTQSVNVTDNDLPDLVFDSLTPGNYLVRAKMYASNNTANSDTMSLKITDGVTSSGECGTKINVAGHGSTIVCEGVFSYTTTAARTFSMHGAASGATSIQIENDVQGFELTFDVVKYPLSSAEAITAETSGQLLNVRIGSTSTFINPLGVSVPEIEVSTTNPLVLYPGPNNGVSARITCDGTNPATSTTCSVGNEVVGVDFDVAKPGTWEICIGYEWGHGSTASTTDNTMFKLNNVTPDTNTVIQNGTPILHNELGSFTNPQPMSVGDYSCEFFDMVAGRNAVKLFYSSNFASTFIATAGTSFDDASISITGKPVTQTGPQLAFPDITVPLASKMGNSTGITTTYESCQITNGGVPVIDNSSGLCDFVDSITDNGVGIFSVNFVSGTFSQEANCICSTNNVATDVNCVVEGSNDSLVSFRTFSGGVAADINMVFSCHGKE